MRFFIIGAVGMVFSWAFLWFQNRSDGLLHVYFLNVGQGDAILVRTPSGKNILVDGGSGNVVLKELAETLPYFDRDIDYLVPTHPDRDHIEGLIHVMRRQKVRAILTTGVHKDDYLSRSFFKTALDKKIPLHVVDKNSDIHFADGVTLDILYPLKKDIRISEDTNNTSLVMKVIFGENEILLPGDAEFPEEGLLLAARADLKADVLKVGHHGSKSSTTKEFLRAVGPTYAVISVGVENRYGHPNPHILQRLASAGITTLRTDTCGRIHFAFSSETRLMHAPSACNFPSNRS